MTKLSLAKKDFDIGQPDVALAKSGKRQVGRTHEENIRHRCDVLPQMWRPDAADRDDRRSKSDQEDPGASEAAD